MSSMNRRDFLNFLTANDDGGIAEKTTDAVFAKYANKELPKLERTTSTLAAYSGSWTRAEIVHLLRRTMFGVREADVQALQNMTMAQAVDYLLTNTPATPAPPVNNYETSTYTDPTGIASGQTWVNAPYGTGGLNGRRGDSLKAWWIGLMLNQNLSIQEKMTFFWYNHFSTEITSIFDARMSYSYVAMLRQNSLGNFKSLVKQVTKHPAMLKYLNGYVNAQVAPDENYGRELQELFTLGKANNPNYTENDVKAAAKVLTGWRINSSTLTSYFDPAKHDTSNKQFSSFYNNTVINGQTGMNGANEADALVDMIFTKTETAKFICRKLYRFFVYYVIDADVENNVIAPLAQILINNNFEIVPVLKALFKSQHFFDTNNRGCFIRTPLDHILGTLRTFNVGISNTLTVEKTYAIWNYLRTNAANLALDLGDPPNVAGYPAYYQVPEYYELWINSNTLPKRLAFTDMLNSTGFTASTGFFVKINVLNFAAGYVDADDPDALVDYCVEMLLGVDISATRRADLKSILLGGQTTNSYWGAAWLAYLSNANYANTNAVQPKLVSMITEIMRMPEYQLC